MKRRSLFFALVISLAFTSMVASRNLYAGGKATGEQLPAEGHRMLKKYMANFGSMISGLEIMRLKEKKPDWEAINLTLQEMSNTLTQMQSTDTANVYKEYTDMLAAGLVDLKEKAKKKDKTIFNDIDELSNTCFKCHAVHRPADFLLPKKNRRMSSY